MNKSADYSHILRECADIADERGEQYGTSRENMEHTALLMYHMFNVHLKPEVIAQVLIANKFSRQAHKPKKDNIEDAINYLAIMQNLQDNPTKE